MRSNTLTRVSNNPGAVHSELGRRDFPFRFIRKGDARGHAFWTRIMRLV